MVPAVVLALTARRTVSLDNIQQCMLDDTVTLYYKTSDDYTSH